ncbi:MAG TPA: cobalamin-binding protein [Candidatus Marinimicrobia bacterium]|nr:cobalamin-binding protein [Candidatus Neomarinimicrobiota bacterium]
MQTAIEQSLPLDKILNEGLIAGMEITGEKFSKGLYFVPEMLFSAKAMKAGLELLRPGLALQQELILGKVILGSVQGDMHDIGKNLVGMLLEGAGFEVIDLGVNQPASNFMKAAIDFPQAIVGLSALLTTTMQKMTVVIAALRSAGLENPIIIGGAPVTPAFAAQIGADGYAKNATEAVQLVKSMIQKGI